MTRSEILEVQAVAAETFGCDPHLVTGATAAADIEKWDSLRHLIFIAGLEQEFQIEFDMNATMKMTNVGGLVSLIEEGLR